MPPHVPDLDRQHRSVFNRFVSSRSTCTPTCRPAVPSKRTAFSVEDFRVVKPIGHGDMGNVYLVVLEEDNSPYAMKVMKKEVLAARENFHRAQTEREILEMVNHPFLPRLLTHFETDKHTFLVTNFCSGGDLNVLRQKQPDKRFSENAARFYAAEVLLALEYLHKQGIVYRDLKPENILIQENGHIMLTDFDLSLNLATARRYSSSSTAPFMPDKPHKLPVLTKYLSLLKSLFRCRKAAEHNGADPKCGYGAVKKIFPRSCSSDCRSNSFVGTEEYVAPEVIWGSGHGMPVDWWTFGVLLHEMVYGKTPFKGDRRKDTFYNILCKEVDIPGPSSPVKDLITRLLVKNPEHRLVRAEQVRKHAFFEGVGWEDVERIPRPPVVPPPFSLPDVCVVMEEKVLNGRPDEVLKQIEESVEDVVNERDRADLYDKFVNVDIEGSVLDDLIKGEKGEKGERVEDGSSLGGGEGLSKALEMAGKGESAVGLVFQVGKNGEDGECVGNGEVVVVVDEFDEAQQRTSSFDIF